LVKLRESVFGMGCGHSQKRHDPHPEYGTRPAEVERQGDTGNVSGTNPRRETDGERLKGRNALWVTGLCAEATPHLPKIEDLYEPQTESEKDTNTQENVYEDVVPNDIIYE